MCHRDRSACRSKRRLSAIRRVCAATNGHAASLTVADLFGAVLECPDQCAQLGDVDGVTVTHVPLLVSPRGARSPGMAVGTVTPDLRRKAQMRRGHPDRSRVFGVTREGCKQGACNS
ncbi:hypothetical protein LY40_004087 [Prauserella salsuginis]|nr:hypothetical protein [Prauserella salsuginis]